MAQPMGDNDIRKYCPNAKIMRYPDLQNYKDFDDLLPNNGDSCFVLYLDSPNSGHWVLLSRYRDNDGHDWVEHFDSYKLYPDAELKFIPEHKREQLGTNENYVVQMMNNSDDLKKVYNITKYQNDGDNVATCGKHCVMRYLALKKGMNLPEYKSYMNRMKKLLNVDNYDKVVTSLIR